MIEVPGYPVLEDVRLAAAIDPNAYAKSTGTPHPIGGYDEIEFFRLLLGRAVVWGEVFQRQGKKHRLDGPAGRTFRTEDRVLYSEGFHFEGAPHRLGGPALTYYRLDGTVEKESFYLYGESYACIEAVLDVVLMGSDAEIAADLAASEFAGLPPTAVAEALLAGVTTLDGVRAVLDGSPVEWAQAFESGAALDR